MKCIVYIFGFQEAEKNHLEEFEKVEKEKMEIEAKLEEMVKQENVLSAKVGIV